MTPNRKPLKKIALTLSLCLIVLWAVFGTGASLAWFMDTDEDIKNVFNFAEFDLMVEYRGQDGNFYDIEGSTDLFDKNALYEPGFTQVVYLKVTNLGTVPFVFKTAVTVLDYNNPINIFGQQFNLANYLVFGVTPYVGSEAEMDALVADRELAKNLATTPLSNYNSNPARLEAGQTVYMALIVYMPEEVDNNANYMGDEVPTVELGLSVSASQIKD